MSEQLEANVDLLSVTKSVAETDRRRVLVEEELNQAQSIVESLKARSLSLSESVLDLQRQLDAAKAAKAREDSELSALAQRRKIAIDELTTLTAIIDELRSVSQSNTAQIGDKLEEARIQLGSVESNVTAAQTEAAAMRDNSASLRRDIEESRRHTDALEAKLALVERTTDSVLCLAGETQSRIAEAHSALETAANRKRETDDACSALTAISSALRAKAADAATTMKAMDHLIAEQDAQTVELAARVVAVSQLVGRDEPARRTNGSAEASPPKSARSHSATDRLAAPAYAVAVLAHERLLAVDEAERLEVELSAGASDIVLRESWSKTVSKPHSPAHRLIFAEVLHAVDDLKAAVVYYEQAAVAKTAHPIIRYLVALAYLKMDLLDRSARIEQMLSRDRGGRVFSRIIEGMRAEQTGRLDEAGRALTDAAAIKGAPKWEHDEALVRLAGFHERRGDAAAAISCYEQISGEGPGHTDVYERIRALASGSMHARLPL